MAVDYRSGARIAAASSLVLLATDAAARPAEAPQPAARPAGTVQPPAPVPAAAPSLLWQDVTALGVACLVHTGNGVDHGALHDRLCAAVRAQAAKGAPVPVKVAAPDAAALAPGQVTLLVHANVERVRGADVMALSVRPFRNAADAGQFFGAAPRVVAAGDAAALDRAVAALLAETLPWQAGPSQAGGARPGHPRPPRS
ncbi:hypothetical protein [uncultured Sphingomonas sp.]|uniref:hypothetical protein n=1 Tax=uncultured Sphingomonas sp. TaxID=158754 RepID=UPI003747A15F